MDRERLDYLEDKLRDISELNIELCNLQSVYENTYMSDAEYLKEKEAILNEFLEMIKEIK